MLCLLSDSTRAENPGYTPSERTVGEAFRDIMEGLDGPRHRGHLRQQHRAHPAGLRRRGDVRAQGRRHRALDGAEHRASPPTWATCTYDAGQLVPKDRIKDIADSELVIATTGAQGEPMAGLARMANRDHRFVEIVPGDTVIVSASPIPGNEE